MPKVRIHWGYWMTQRANNVLCDQYKLHQTNNFRWMQWFAFYETRSILQTGDARIQQDTRISDRFSDLSHYRALSNLTTSTVQLQSNKVDGSGLFGIFSVIAFSRHECYNCFVKHDLGHAENSQNSNPFLWLSEDWSSTELDQNRNKPTVYRQDSQPIA